jgi:class 3 adenylate cyclase
VRFAIEELQVRVGVSTDALLIAAVLETDESLFDIIGDPINVAATAEHR